MTAFRRGAHARLHSLLQLVGTRSAVTISTRLEGTSLAAGCDAGPRWGSQVSRCRARLEYRTRVSPAGSQERTPGSSWTRPGSQASVTAEQKGNLRRSTSNSLLTAFTCSMRRRSTYTAEGDDAPDWDHAAVLDETGPSVTLAPWDLSSLEALLAHTPCLYGLAQNANRTRRCSLRSPERGFSGSPAIPPDSRHAQSGRHLVRRTPRSIQFLAHPGRAY